MVTFDEENILVHYGILRKSGRYPWGSGGNVPQRSRKFLDTIEALKQQGMSEGEIAKGFGMKAIDLRAMRSVAVNAVKADRIAQVQRMRDKGWSPTAISERLDLPESTVRSYLKIQEADTKNAVLNTSDMLRREVDSKGLIDVGRGVENHMGVSRERKLAAISVLKEEGYEVYYIKEPQLGTGKETTKMILAAPGTTYSEAFAKRGDVKGPVEASDDYGETWFGIKPPIAVSPSRVEVNYDEDGGSNYDGVIYLRPGVSDLDMRGKSYGQVRIQVGKDHYLKGMAVYKDDLPDGVDIVFNTNKKKSETAKKTDAFKELTGDADNPFGAVVDQIRDNNGNVTSALNLVNEQGDWQNWSNTIASQVLSKQSPTLAKEQLNMTMERRVAEYEEISGLTNPTVKRRLLKDFSESTDAAAVHLKAAALPGQRWHVILPVDSLKDNEIFAPNYNDGDTVALIRYPHGGTFEIPELRVNNKHRPAKSMIGTDAQDAVGINARVAERLSGADFDGDTVLVIPNRNRKIESSKPLKELEGFNPKESYRRYEGMKVISPQRKQQEMGDVSNLITDMTIKGASNSEIARAVKHSMVVIDAEKHKLNYKQSAIDNDIRGLKEKYQGGPRRGASTLISRAESPTRLPERIERRAREGGPFDPTTGKKQYTETGASYVNAKGETVFRTSKVAKLAATDDAHTLSSNTPIERIYADHSNRLKGLANQARVDLGKTPRAKQSPSAKKVYAEETASLNRSLDLALRNAPLERQAQTIANAIVRQKKQENPNMDGDTEKKIKFQALETSRARMGAKKLKIQFTPREWEAIQAGAISDSKLSQLLDHADMDHVRELATPKTRTLMTGAKTTRAASMLKAGATRIEVAQALGVSLTTLDNSLAES